MGLDVYLYRYEDYIAAKTAEKIYEKQSEENWEAIGGYSNASEEQRKEINKKNRELQETLNYSFENKRWGELPGETEIEINSEKYPDHLFKVGYFRSSYNDNGIERVIKNLIGIAPLHYIFDPGNEYEFAPNWNIALERVKKILQKLDEKTTNGAFSCFSEGQNPYKSPSYYRKINEKRALEIFYEEKQEHQEDKIGKGYSNINGTFFPNGLTIKGIVPGANCLGAPCVFIITDLDIIWFHQALEIVEETILWVLAKDEIEQSKYYLCWSS